MVTNVPTRRVACVLLIACVAGAAALVVGCSSSRTPLTGSPGTVTTTPAATSTASQSTATPTAPTVDAAGAAISSTLTITPGSRPAVGNIPRPTDAAAIAAAKKVILENEGTTVSTGQVIKLTQDSKGHWWILLSVTVSSGEQDKAVVTFDGKKWDEQIFGQDINNADLPRDVRF